MAESELKNYDDFVTDTSSTKKRAIKVQFRARRAFIQRVTVGICVCFVVIGACLIGIGANLQKSDTQALVRNQIAVSVIVVGCFVLFIGLLGFLGTMMDHKGVIAAYEIVLLIMFVVQVFVASFVLSDSNNATNLVTSGWNSANPATRANIQNDFNCCGIFPNVSVVLPCPPGTSASYSCQCGCSASVVNDLKARYWPAGFVGIILVLLQLAGLLFGFWLICGKRESPEDKKKKKKPQEIEATTTTTGEPAEGKKDKEKKKKKKELKTGELR